MREKVRERERESKLVKEIPLGMDQHLGFI